MTLLRRHEPHRAGTPAFALFCLLGSGAMFGASANLAKVAVRAGLSPLAYLFWSIAGAAIILVSAAVRRRGLPPLTRHTLEYYGVSAFVGVAASNLIMFSAIPHVGAGFVALVIALPPLFTYIGALGLRLERFRALRAAGVIAALLGSGLLAARKLAAPGTDDFWVFFVLLAPVLLAIGNLYRTMRWPEGVPADALTPGILVASAVMLLPAGLLPGFSLRITGDGNLPLLLIGAQAVAFAAQFFWMMQLQKAGGPVLLSLMGSVGTMVGVPAAIFLLGEAPPQGLFAGAGLIVAGVVLVSVGRGKPRFPSRPAAFGRPGAAGVRDVAAGDPPN